MQSACQAAPKLSAFCEPNSLDSSHCVQCVYDGNGNVIDYVDSNGSSVAHYEYGPFGEIVASSGEKKDDFAHRFSSKPYEAETGILRYQLRDYIVELERWISRDPIGEKGGVHLYGFVGNETVGRWDYLGRMLGSSLLRRATQNSPAWGCEIVGSVTDGLMGYTGGEAVMFFPATCQIAFYRFQYSLVEKAIDGMITEVEIDPTDLNVGVDISVSGGISMATPIGSGKHDAESWTGNFYTLAGGGGPIGRVGFSAFFSSAWVGGGAGVGASPIPAFGRYSTLDYTMIGSAWELDNQGMLKQCLCDSLRFTTLQQTFAVTVLNEAIRLIGALAK